jgi:two-component system, NtrC family, sensor kinase
MTALELLGALARILNAGRDADAALASAAGTIRSGLGASVVTIWVRSPGSRTFYAIASPPEAASAEVIPAPWALPAEPGATRVPLQRGDELLGQLEAAGIPEDAAQVLRIVGDMLTPFLASLQLTAALGREVELRSLEIEEQRRFTELVIDCLPVGLYVVDRDYRIRVWNRKRETGTQGLLRDDVVGRRVFDVLTRQPANQLRAEFDAVFTTGRISETELEVPGGDETRYYRITKIPMRLEGDTVSHVITIGEDMTARHAIQERVLQTEKLAAIGQLAAGVMHEINNPLATIGACVAACEMRLGDVTGSGVPAIREYCDIIDKEVQRCTRIVDGLLDFSRPKGKARRPADLGGVVDDALFLLTHHQRFKSLTLEREIEAGLPPVLANTEQLIQAFMTVMLNALDAMEGGGQLTVRARRGGRGDEVMVEIGDTGVGITAAEQTKIFEPFYTTKPAGRGTGLGLSICYGIVQEHRGRLEVDSQPGRGSTFRIVLPVYTESA